MTPISTIKSPPMNPLLKALLTLQDEVKELKESRDNILRILEAVTASADDDRPRLSISP